MYLRQGLEDGDSHKRVINSNDENTAGILKFGVIDISWNMGVTAPRAYREISSRDTKSRGLVGRRFDHPGSKHARVTY